MDITRRHHSRIIAHHTCHHSLKYTIDAIISIFSHTEMQLDYYTAKITQRYERKYTHRTSFIIYLLYQLIGKGLLFAIVQSGAHE
jgi:hypothetical protein